jgi:hypothetical protein
VRCADRVHQFRATIASIAGYDAGPGWNACAGLGVPKGADIVVALAAVPITLPIRTRGKHVSIGKQFLQLVLSLTDTLKLR